MGYLAITSHIKDMVVLKTSETIFVRRKKTFNFLEIEIAALNSGQFFKQANPKITILIPGRIYNAKCAVKVMKKETLRTWYYSEKEINDSNPGLEYLINGNMVKFVQSNVDSSDYDSNHDVTNLEIQFNFDGQPDIKSLITFVTFKRKSDVEKHLGNVFAESRYFDKKQCKGRFSNSVILQNGLVPIKNIFCWMIVPRGYVPTDYTCDTCENEVNLRDIRIIEEEYSILLGQEKKFFEFCNKMMDKIVGRPQVINWHIRNKKSEESGEDSFLNQNKNIGEWTPYRLFATCSGYSQGTVFLLVTSIASIVSILVPIVTRVLVKIF